MGIEFADESREQLVNEDDYLRSNPTVKYLPVSESSRRTCSHKISNRDEDTEKKACLPTEEPAPVNTQRQNGDSFDLFMFPFEKTASL